MKKTFLLLALALMGLTASADPTFTITYTPQGGTEQTITEGTTHDLGDLKGSITISGSTITFDNVVVELGAGFLITPSDLTASYVLDLQFTGYNVVSADLTPAIDVVGNAKRVSLSGDALRAYGWSAPALRMQNGFFRVGMLELYAHEASADYFVIEMGAGEKLDILADDSYGRVCLERVHNALAPLALSPLTNGASVIDDKATTGRTYYGTSTMKQTIPASIGGFTLNQGNLPFVTRILPGYKSGTFTVEDRSNREGNFVNFNIKDLEMATDRQNIFDVKNANLMLNVEGTNNIMAGSNILFAVDNSHEDMFGQIEIKGVEQNAILTMTAIDNYFPAIYSQSNVSFGNLTAKIIMDPRTGHCEHEALGNAANAESYLRQLIIKNTAKVMLLQKNVDQYTPGLTYGFWSLGLGLTNTHTNPINGTFTNNQLTDEYGNKLHVAYFDTEVYGIELDEQTPICSLNADDVLADGTVSFNNATSTLSMTHAAIDRLDVEKIAITLTAGSSTIGQVYAPEVTFLNCNDLVLNGNQRMGTINFHSSDVTINGSLEWMISVPTFSGCHALEYSEFALDNTDLYGINGTTQEKVTKLTVVKDGNGLFTTSQATPATKTIRNGQLLIERAGQTYNVQGVQVK